MYFDIDTDKIDDLSLKKFIEKIIDINMIIILDDEQYMNKEDNLRK